MIPQLKPKFAFLLCYFWFPEEFEFFRGLNRENFRPRKFPTIHEKIRYTKNFARKISTAKNFDWRKISLRKISTTKIFGTKIFVAKNFDHEKFRPRKNSSRKFPSRKIPTTKNFSAKISSTKKIRKNLKSIKS